MLDNPGPYQHLHAEMLRALDIELHNAFDQAANNEDDRADSSSLFAALGSRAKIVWAWVRQRLTHRDGQSGRSPLEQI